MAQARIGAQRRQEGLLQAVLRVDRANAGDEEPMQLGGMVVDESLERWQVHTGGNAASHRFVRPQAGAAAARTSCV